MATSVLAWLSKTFTKVLGKTYVWPERIVIDLSKGVRSHLPPNWSARDLQPEVIGVLQVTSRERHRCLDADTGPSRRTDGSIYDTLLLGDNRDGSDKPCSR